MSVRTVKAFKSFDDDSLRFCGHLIPCLISQLIACSLQAPVLKLPGSSSFIPNHGFR